MAKDTEKKLADIFAAHDTNIAAQKRAADEERAQRAVAAKKWQQHLGNVVAPELRRLAALIQGLGQRATVQESADAAHSTSSAKLIITPSGVEVPSANDCPSILYHSSSGGIATQVHQVFPGAGGTSSSGPFYDKPEELTAEKVEADVMMLIEKTFGRALKTPQAR